MKKVYMNEKRDWEVGNKVELTFGIMAGKKGTIVEVDRKRVCVTVELEDGMEVIEGMMYMKELLVDVEITEKEHKVAEVILDTMEAYGENFSDVDMDTLKAATGYSLSTIKGVLGSLHKKGLTFEEDVNGENNVYYLTEKGFLALTGKAPEYL